MERCLLSGECTKSIRDSLLFEFTGLRATFGIFSDDSINIYMLTLPVYKKGKDFVMHRTFQMALENA